MFPSAGYLLEARAEVSSFALGSSGLVALEKSFNANPQAAGINSGNWFLKAPPATNNYFRFGTNARFYYNFDNWFPLSSWVLRLNLDLGLIKTFDQQLISENYRMGGVGVGNVTGLRGYALNTVGPVLGVGHDRENEALRHFVLGGNKQVLMNLELEFPLIKSMRLTGVLFFDMGNVYSPTENYFYIGGTRDPYYTGGDKKSFSDPLGTFYGLGLFSSVGFGLRWFSPMAPIRVEFGFPIVKRPSNTPGIFSGDQNYQVEFNIGQSF
jgi:outer membrane protein assembly factor BamA